MTVLLSIAQKILDRALESATGIVVEITYPGPQPSLRGRQVLYRFRNELGTQYQGLVIYITSNTELRIVNGSENSWWHQNQPNSNYSQYKE